MFQGLADNQAQKHESAKNNPDSHIIIPPVLNSIIIQSKILPNAEMVILSGNKYNTLITNINKI
jgi:hypothetical protein